jgi:hypothetical protein
MTIVRNPKKSKKVPVETSFMFPLYVPIKVELIDNLRELGEDWGQCTEDDNGNCIIKIEKKLRGPMLRRTLYHEAIHAVFDRSGISYILDPKQEEAIVRAIENLFICNIPYLEGIIDEIEKTPNRN